jgi:TetR/AcrR family transcriptional regulator, regulator of cefoperazone and chloramphenicol sensitivity
MPTRTRPAGRSAATRGRILNAAGELFAEKGYGDTTVRDICARARVNLASVNYHFRGKENLLAEVARHGFESRHAKYAVDHKLAGLTDPGRRLRQFIWNMIAPRHDPDLPGWFPDFMARNFQFAHAHVRPLMLRHKTAAQAVLADIVAELMAAPRDGYAVRIAAAGVMGVVFNYMRPHTEAEGRFPEVKSPRDLERFIDHVYAFALGGIASLRQLEKRSTPS